MPTLCFQPSILSQPSMPRTGARRPRGPVRWRCCFPPAPAPAGKARDVRRARPGTPVRLSVQRRRWRWQSQQAPPTTANGRQGRWSIRPRGRRRRWQRTWHQRLFLCAASGTRRMAPCTLATSTLKTGWNRRASRTGRANRNPPTGLAPHGSGGGRGDNPRGPRPTRLCGIAPRAARWSRKRAARSTRACSENPLAMTRSRPAFGRAVPPKPRSRN
mmetsp:Transcript_31136/g.85285  ORF Transcript_31136/g.85285 Transcript_31136/m.85285 type:complete len:216 (-) Transcript_31136:261-908(-)